MASVGKFVAALTSVSNEVTMAVAQFNMDFTLMKVEAPQEYQGLGAVLSPNRREQAEAGLPHTTARKLGALFEHIIPDTPKLYAAYGQRSSGIAKSHAMSGTTSHTSPFSAHEGLEATSLWAAATSGKHAIAVHLLACMLSSMQTTASLMAARQEITRAHLGAWDASARAWLQSADEANRVRQTQLRLVLDNITIPVNSQASLYRSVLKAWTGALVMVEGLVAGAPQSVHDGAVLLALSAWHLYPDMLVLGPNTTRIEQSDILVESGGILTVGLQYKGDIESGVSWSLPLAHMRYYGDAPIVSRSLANDSSRISFEQLYQVVLGCLSVQWNMSLDDVTNIIVALQSTLSTQREALGTNANGENNNRCLMPNHWFSTLYEAASISRNSWGQNKEHFTRLSSFGTRRGKAFLNRHSENSKPSFGLNSLEVLLPLTTGVEAQITLLRGISKNLDLHPNDIFIRYRSSEDQFSGGKIEYASALPHLFETLKRSLDGNLRTVKSHIRWTCRFKQQINRPMQEANEHNTLSDWLATQKRHFEKLQSTDNNMDQELMYPGAYEGSEDPTEFEFLMGDINHAALFARRSLAIGRRTAFGYRGNATTEELLAALEGKLINPEKLEKHLNKWGLLNEYGEDLATKNVTYSLRNLAAAKSFYDNLAYATVNLAVIAQSLHDAKWAHDYYANRRTAVPLQLNLPQRFSCTAMFESGTFNIAPEHLHRVLALAVGNSIYVAKFLLHKPSYYRYGGRNLAGITRLTGSLGRPEMAMLVNPKAASLLKDLDYGNWDFVNHDRFDGQRQNSFPNTTLHLSFTDFEMPVDVGTRGIRDTEVILMETVISLHDRGHWIGDLDIMSTWESNKLCGWEIHTKCSHSNEHRSFENSLMAGRKPELVSIDIWNELLDMPSENMIVRAHGNWAASLAAATISIKKERHTVFLHPDICWDCLLSQGNIQKDWGNFTFVW